MKCANCLNLGVRFYAAVVSAKIRFFAFAAVVAGLSLGIRADVPSSAAYCQEGLLAHWDGIENAGRGVAHAAAATTWADLSGNGNTLILDADLAAFQDGMALYCNGSASGSGKYAAHLGKKLDTYQTVEVCYHRTGSNIKQLILHSGNNNQSRYLYDRYLLDKGIQFSKASPMMAVGDTKATTNTVAGVYGSSSAASVDEAYLNGAYGVKAGAENMYGGCGFFTLGENYDSGRLFKGEIFAVRLYGRKLTNAECRRNAALDEMRFCGTVPEDVRWNSATEKFEFRLRLATDVGLGGFLVNGAPVAAGEALWFEDGASVTLAYGGTPAGISETGAWKGVPYDADLSDDGRTATVTIKGPFEPTYEITSHTLTTDEIVSTDITAQRIVNGDRIVYVFANVNESATVTLRKDMTLREALVVGGGNGVSGGTVVSDGVSRIFRTGSTFTATVGKANTASSFACVGAEITAAGGAGTPAESSITGETKTYGTGGTGTVILSFTEGVQAGQPEIPADDPVITFPGEYTFPHVELTLSGDEGAVYSARVTVEFGVSGGEFAASNVFEGVVNGQRIEAEDTLPVEPGQSVVVRVTVTADGAETRTRTKTAVATGKLPPWAAVPPSAYAQNGLLACWDGGENAGAGRHVAVTDRWIDTKGGRAFALSSSVGVGFDRMTFASNSAWGDLSAADTSATFNKAATPLTVEVVETMNKSDGGRYIAIQAPGGVNIGYYGGCLLANNARVSSYAMDWTGTNTIAVLYNSNKETQSAWSNGTQLGKGSATDNTAGSGSLTTVGNRQNHAAAFTGSLYALRLYEGNLTSAELARNRAVDRIRFMGATQDETGFRWNASTQSATLRITAATAGAGQIRVNDAEVASGAANWFADGETVTVEYVPDGIVTEAGAWQNVPGDATVSDDGLTVTLTAAGPVDLLYAISQVETEDIVTDDASMRRVVTEAGTSYVFTNGQASVTLKRDRLLAHGLIATDGESVECNDIALSEGTELTVVAAPSGTSSLILPGKTYSASGGAGSVTLTLADPVAAGQPEIVEGSVRISFPDGLAMPCGTMTLGGEPGAIYAAKVVVELGVNDGPTLSSNVVEGAVMGSTIGCDGHFFALPTDTVWLRVTVSAADAETRTKEVSAASEGVCPNCAYIPASAYVQRGLVACWDGGENAGPGHHLNEMDCWTDLSGTYSFALTDTTVGLDGMTFMQNSSIGVMSAADAQATFGQVKPGTAEVVEYTAYDPNGRSVAISSGMSPGVLIGQMGGNVLANVAREDFYAFNWKGTTNTVSVAYDANRHTTGAWANGAPLELGGGTENTGVSSEGTVGNRRGQNISAAPLKGTVYCIRLYSEVLTDDELALNNAIDRVRFGQAPAAEAGLRWNRDLGRLEGRVRCQTNGHGTFTFEDLASSDATAWQKIGETVTAVYHPAELDDEPVGWINLPADAVVSADGFSVTLPVKDATEISFAVAKTLRVTPDADDATGTGETWSSPVSLTRAFELAAGAGCILCKAGTYDITAPIVVRGTMSVEGGFAGTDDVTLAADPVSVLDAQGRSAVADVMTVTSETGSGNVLKRLCFRGGYRHGLNKTGAAPLAVHGCRFEANGATAPETDATQIYGRGLSCTGSGTETLIVSNCVFAGNVKTVIEGCAGYGFALGVRNLARVVVDDTIFITNGFNYAAPPRGRQLGKSGCGGTAIFAQNAPITARRCRFIANHGMCYDEAVAGGIVRLAGAGGGSTFENCVWSGNEEPCGSDANGGGAVLANGISGALSVSFDTTEATCDVIGCTFAYNLSDAWFAPAAVHLLKGTMTLRNSIVFGNLTSTGCRVGRDVYVRADGSLSVDHTLFGTNEADRIVAADGATLTLGEGVKYGDPLFVTPFADVQPLATISGGPGSNFKPDAATRAALTVFNVHLRGGSGYVDETTGGKVRIYRESKVGGSSSALDAGVGDYSHEPKPNGNRVNLGVYGNTPWATMSPGGMLIYVK